MSADVVKVLAPRQITAPRGSRWAAAATVWITRWLTQRGAKAAR